VALDDVLVIEAEASEDVLELDDAMRRLAAFDERKSQVVELQFFGGLSYDEVAEALGISAATVHRELKLAKAWLHRDLHSQGKR
jgi:RNA polymerase sigma factor (sigma-70 family)